MTYKRNTKKEREDVKKRKKERKKETVYTI